jgi:glycosyltransferase involved in cell wall biosynthesis
MSRTQIAINATALLSPLTGIGQYVMHLGREILASSEFSPHFFYALGWNTQLRTGQARGVVPIKELVKRWVPKPYKVSRAIQAFRFQEGVQRFHFKLYHEPNYLPFLFHGPIVTTVHDLSFIRHPETHPKARLEVMEQLFPKALARSQRILTDSEFVRQDLIATFNLPAQKVVRCYLGASEEYRPRGIEETRGVLDPLGLRHGGYVLAVGTLEPRKNLHTVLNAYRLVPERLRSRFPLAVVGMKGWLVDELARELEPLVRAGQVRVLGYVTKELLPSLYAGAKVFVFPSIYEGFGLPPLEAMASGVPVIASNCASLPEVIGNTGVQLDPYDERAWAEAITRLLEDRAEVDQRVASALARAKTFTWSRCAEVTQNVYRQAISAW